ncbi:MAG: Flp pilus assembly protein CpaB [Carboxydocellales bacterium]
MNLKTRLFLMIILSGLISLSSYYYLQGLKETVQVVVASQDILPRTKIMPNMVKKIIIGQREGILLAANAYNSIEQVVGLTTRSRIEAGEVIKQDARKVITETGKNITRDSKLNKSYFIPEHLRVLGVSVDSQGLVGNELQQGDVVDVIYTSKVQELTAFAVTIIQHVEIFSIANAADEGGLKEQQIINLLVTPEQASALALAKRNGSIDLALNPSGGETVQPLVTNTEILLKGKMH